MSHANARLTVHGRVLLVERILSGRPAAHVAAELGVSRQCAHHWLRRFRDEGPSGLVDRSSRPHHCPRRTAAPVEAVVVQLRRSARRGQDWIGAELDMPARTVSSILRRHQMPYLRDCDPLTGEVIRASKSTAVRYERDRPGELIHMDVKKIGRIPDGGGWKAHGPQMAKTSAAKKARIGFDYVHSVIDDHSRLAYSEILPDEKGATCAAFLLRAADYFATAGIPRIERVMTDNAFAYRYSTAMRTAIERAVAFQRELAIEEDRTARATILAEGCEITELTAGGHAQFRDSVAPLTREARGTYGQKMFDMI